MKKLEINTGPARNVLGHVISGAIASAVVSGAANYKKAQNGEIKTCQAIKDTVKRASQGAIATGSAIATANYIGEGNWLKALTSLSIGAVGVYALEVVEEKLEQKYLTNENIELIGEGNE